MKAREHLAAWVRGLGVNDPGVSPNHGWRHTFKALGFRCDIPEKILDAIVGHAPASIGRGYGEPTLADKARELHKFPRYRPRSIDGARSLKLAADKSRRSRQNQRELTVINKGLIFDGLVFATYRDRALYIRTLVRDRPQWLKDNPELWETIEDAQRKDARSAEEEIGGELSGIDRILLPALTPKVTATIPRR